MKLVDANIIIRFLTKDQKHKAERCKRLFEDAVKGKIKLYISDLTVAEVVWVLEKVYKCSRTDIREKVEAILNTPNLIFQNKEIIAECTILYDIHNIDFIDAYHAVLMSKRDIEEIYSYNTDFDILERIIRKEP
ncbi:MAG: PIN domain-containing protein [Candidatus Margulisiibacteriota bacterium]